MANVRFDNITVRYGSNTVLDNFSLEVESGKIVCLVGPSGCGKTTLVRALLGLNKPETGTITVGDRVLFDAKKRINVPAEKRNIGIVFQDYAVWPHMTVVENGIAAIQLQNSRKFLRAVDSHPCFDADSITLLLTLRKNLIQKSVK